MLKLYVVAACSFLVLSCAAAVPLAAQTYAPGWTQLNDTKLQSVCPSDGFGGATDPNGTPYQFSKFCQYVIRAWGGGIFDAAGNRSILWGGGHSDYGGNEIYSVNYGQNPPTVTRLNDPSTPLANYGNCSPAAPDGKPNARHTYNGMAYHAAARKMFVFNGGVYCGNGSHFNDTWMLDLATLTWTRMDPTNGTDLTRASDQPYASANYDPNTQDIFVAIPVSGTIYLYKYTYGPKGSINSYSPQLSNGPGPENATGVIDVARKKLFLMGSDNTNAGRIVSVDISSNSKYALNDITAQTSGCSGLISSAWPGLAYEPISQTIVGWNVNKGNSVYVFDPGTNECSTYDYSGGPSTGSAPGTFGRWQRIGPGIFAAVAPDWNLDTYVLSIPELAAERYRRFQRK